MVRNYTIRTKILRPVAEVFDAVAASDKLCHYFTSQASGDLEEGAVILWRWHHYDVESPVVVDNVIANELMQLTLDSKVWKTDADGLKGSHDNCGGWTHLATCLKASVVHGMDLR